MSQNSPRTSSRPSGTVALRVATSLNDAASSPTTMSPFGFDDTVPTMSTGRLWKKPG
jgi:hypothetical protein